MTATITAGPIASRSANVERSFELGLAHRSNDMTFYRRAISPMDPASRRNMLRVVVLVRESTALRVAVGPLTPEQSIAGDQNLPLYYSIPRHMRRYAHLSADTLFTGTETVQEWNIEPHFVQKWNARSVSDLPPVVQEFALGVAAVAPARDVVAKAEHVVRAAIEHTVGPHITVDDEDGDLDFHLRLANGLLVMANLFLDGSIDASVYDDSQGVPVKTVKRMRRATTSAEELVSLFMEGNRASTS